MSEQEQEPMSRKPIIILRYTLFTIYYNGEKLSGGAWTKLTHMRLREIMSWKAGHIQDDLKGYTIEILHMRSQGFDIYETYDLEFFFERLSHHTSQIWGNELTNILGEGDQS